MKWNPSTQEDYPLQSKKRVMTKEHRRVVWSWVDNYYKARNKRRKRKKERKEVNHV